MRRHSVWLRCSMQRAGTWRWSLARAWKRRSLLGQRKSWPGRSHQLWCAGLRKRDLAVDRVGSARVWRIGNFLIWDNGRGIEEKQEFQTIFEWRRKWRIKRSWLNRL